MGAASEELQSAARATSYAVILQVLFRLLTFATNSLVLRLTTKAALGVVNVRLMLLYTTTLFLAREAFRKACLSVNRHDLSHKQWRRMTNLVFHGVILGAFIASALVYVWLYWLKQPEIEHYDVGVVVFALSAVLELLVEPAWVLSQINLKVKLKVVAEGTALALRTFVGVAALYVLDSPVIAFSIAQLVHTAALLGVYIHDISAHSQDKSRGAAIRSVRDLFPASTSSTLPWYSDIPQDLAQIARSFIEHGVLKQLLTEGEKFLMTISHVLSFSQQGVYDVVNNLGSMVARFVFHPLEENYYTFFAALLKRDDVGHVEDSEASREESNAEEMETASDGSQAKAKKREGGQTKSPQRTPQTKTEKSLSGKRKPSDVNALTPEQRQENEKLAGRALALLLKFVCLIGAIAAVFGQTTSKTALHIYGGASLSEGEGPLLLQTYSVYILFMALNGITECFVAASSSKAEIQDHNRWMVVFSVIFVVASHFLTQRLGAVGFIVANTLNMALRSAKSFQHIAEYATHHHLFPSNASLMSQIIPHPYILVSLAAAFVANYLSEQHYIPSDSTDFTAQGTLMHVGVTGGTLATVLASIAFKERQFLNSLRLLWRGELEKKDK
eukprot:m.187817 g.187817  ORF g.187817 m.187817 type:complete len:615 (+) comp14781_c1_seq1:200-2044(+)